MLNLNHHFKIHSETISFPDPLKYLVGNFQVISRPLTYLLVYTGFSKWTVIEGYFHSPSMEQCLSGLHSSTHSSSLTLRFYVDFISVSLKGDTIWYQ